MNPNQLIQFLQYPESLNASSLELINKWLEDYPFFQTAHLLRIKSKHNISNTISKEELNKAAAYISDRKILYYLLNAPLIQQPEEDVEYALHHEKDYKESLRDNISDTVSQQINKVVDKELKNDAFTPGVAIDVRKEYGDIHDEEKNHTKRNIEQVEIQIPELLELSEEEEPQLSEEAEDVESEFELESGSVIHQEVVKQIEETAEKPDKVDKHESKPDVISEVKVEIPYDLNQLANESSPASDQVNDISKNDAGSLIDKFIAANPKIVGATEKNQINEDISAESVKEHESFFTDTLAQIYVKQEHYAKAILSYEKLSLKYPEKSTYFAGQIAEIKKLMSKQS